VPPWTLPEKLAMSGVISTVIDSWAFPGSITFSRVKAGLLEDAPLRVPGRFSKPPLSGRRATGRRHALIDLFPYIAPPFSRKSRCYPAKAHPKGDSYI